MLNFKNILHFFANNKYLLIFVHYFTIFETFKIHVYLFRKKIKIRSSVSFEHLVDWCKSLMYVNDTNDTHTPATDWTRRIVCANNVCGPRWACIWCGYIIFHGHVYMQKYINMADGRWAIMGLKVLRPLYRFGVHANDVWVRLPVCVLVCACECVIELYRVWMATIFHKLVCAFDCRCLQLNTHTHTQHGHTQCAIEDVCDAHGVRVQQTSQSMEGRGRLNPYHYLSIWVIPFCVVSC